MKLLSKPASSITYDEVVEFAKENHPEGVELDYKKEPPDKDKLSQLVAAFANTRGGLIIIGVEENRENGRPIKWEGVKDDHYDELSAQVIGNISPIPNFEFHKTEAKNGKVFILIRVFEGDETPYYPHNDSNIWIRTGSIKKSVDIASPEHIELLFKKNEKAMSYRQLNEEIAFKNYQDFLSNAEAERLNEIKEEKEADRLRRIQHEDGDQMPPFKSRIIQQKLGSNASMLTIILQPHNPYKQLIKPLDMEIIIRESVEENSLYSFPILAGHWDSMNNGMNHFSWNRFSGQINCQQIFANGLTFSSHDVFRKNEQEGDYTHLAWFVSQLFITLNGTRNILSKLGYQGSIDGEMKLELPKGTKVVPCFDNALRDNDVKSISSKYSWKIKIDTKILNNEEELKEFVTHFVRNIYWTFGYKEMQKGITASKLENAGYIK